MLSPLSESKKLHQIKKTFSMNCLSSANKPDFIYHSKKAKSPSLGTPSEKPSTDYIKFPKPKIKNPIKSRLDFLSEFGIVPSKGTLIYTNQKPTSTVDSSIKLAEIIGKKNQRTIAKSIDLEKMIQLAKQETLKKKSQKNSVVKSGESTPNQFLTFDFPPSSSSSSMAATPYGKRFSNQSKNLQEIHEIYISCDKLKSENKKTLRGLRCSFKSIHSIKL